jgi:hypothetical protein
VEKKNQGTIATAAPHNNDLIPLLAYKEHEAIAQRANKNGIKRMTAHITRLLACK